MKRWHRDSFNYMGQYGLGVSSSVIATVVFLDNVKAHPVSWVIGIVSGLWLWCCLWARYMTPRIYGHDPHEDITTANTTSETPPIDEVLVAAEPDGIPTSKAVISPAIDPTIKGILLRLADTIINTWSVQWGTNYANGFWCLPLPVQLISSLNKEYWEEVNSRFLQLSRSGSDDEVQWDKAIRALDAFNQKVHVQIKPQLAKLEKHQPEHLENIDGFVKVYNASLKEIKARLDAIKAVSPGLDYGWKSPTSW